MALNREQILKANDLKTEEVQIPEWGGSVKVHTMTGLERDEFESSLIEGKGNDVKRNNANMRAKLLACCLVDDAGNKLFNTKDIDTLGGKSAKALDRAFTVAMKLNGIGEQEVEELTKN